MSYPLDSSMIYVGTDTGVHKSINRGWNWTPLNIDLTTTDVTALVMHPQNPQALYAGTKGGGIFESTDGGASWNPIKTGLTNLSVTNLAIDSKGQTLYAGINGTEMWVYSLRRFRSQTVLD